MSIQFLRGTTAANDSYTGLAGTFSIDTDLNQVRVHDGVTAGGHVVGNVSSIPDATTSESGLMSSSDKTKLDGIEVGAQVNTVTSVQGNTGDVVIPDANGTTDGLLTSGIQTIGGNKTFESTTITFNGSVVINEGAI